MKRPFPQTFAFATALDCLRVGLEVARTTWKNQSLLLRGKNIFPVSEGNRATWLPHVEDLLAEDWVIVGPDIGAYKAQVVTLCDKYIGRQGRCDTAAVLAVPRGMKLPGDICLAYGDQTKYVETSVENFKKLIPVLEWDSEHFEWRSIDILRTLLA